MASFTIGKKLFLGLGTLVLFSFALGITAFISITDIGDHLTNIANVTVKKQTLTHEMATQASDLRSLIRGIEVRGYMKDPAKMETYKQQITATEDAMQADISAILPMLVRPEGKRAAQDMQETLGTIRQSGQAIFEDSMAGNMEGALTIVTNQLLPAQDRQKADVTLMLKIQDELIAADRVDAASLIASCHWVTGIMVTLSCLLGILMIFVIRQINALLRHSVTELTETSAQIACAANQVAASSQSLAQGSSEQAANIEETSSASAEINSMAQRNTENSRAAAEAVTNSGVGFEKTSQSLTEMVDAMDGISASSQKISKIIKVIDAIAFQTNILALNAAVEAARAGEAGMGFAVVADEVRNLAQRCAQAAKDTADLIEESIQRSDGGRVKVGHVVASIQTIAAEASKCKVLVDEINLGSVEQSRGIDQISRAITQMEQVTQSNASGAEESAAAAEQLNAQAESMKAVVGVLGAMVDGGANQRTDWHFLSGAQSLRSLAPTHGHV